jgi:hypothetical protein
MCENCWTGEVTTFSNPADWAEFNLTLTKKLDEGQLRHNSVNHEQSIYECLACGERWKLKAPDDGSGGYLLRQATTVEKKTGPTTIVQIVIIGIFALLFAKLMQYIFGNQCLTMLL